MKEACGIDHKPEGKRIRLKPRLKGQETLLRFKIDAPALAWLQPTAAEGDVEIWAQPGESIAEGTSESTRPDHKRTA